MHTDFHTHILPGIDDGSRNIEMTEAMLRAELKQGIDTVVATPHFYADQESVDSFIVRRAAAYRAYLALKRENPELPQLLPAAEACYFRGIGRSENLTYLSPPGTNLLLLEAPFSQWTRDFYMDVSQLLNVQRRRVILVHIDRFLKYQKDRATLHQIMELDIILQVNTEALQAFGGPRQFEHIRRFGKPIILGSDCHNLTSRKPDMSKGIEIIGKKFGAEVMGELEETEEWMREELGR